MKLTRIDWVNVELLGALISLAILGIAYVATR